MPGQDAGRPRTVYVMWHFPLLSETFIQREIAALGEQGHAVTVVADALVDSPRLLAPARRLMDDAVAILPMDRARLAGYLRQFRRRCPAVLRETCRYLARQRYHQREDAPFRRHVLHKTVYIAGVCAELGATHLHAPWSDLNAVTGGLAAGLLGLPFTMQARAHDVHRTSYLHGLADTFRRAEVVITNTGYNARYLRATYGDAIAELVQIYNGLPLAGFPVRAPRAVQGRPLQLLCVARLIEQKGIDDLLRIADALGRRGVALRVEIIGGAEEGCEAHAEALRQLSASLGLEQVVTFLGERSLAEVVEACHRADLFVLPSRIAADGSRDIIPNALIEALATGLPCVSTRVTGIPEIVEHGVNGLLREPGDVDGMADDIVALATDLPRRQAMARQGRARVVERFDVAANVLRYVEAFAALRRAAS